MRKLMPQSKLSGPMSDTVETPVTPMRETSTRTTSETPSGCTDWRQAVPVLTAPGFTLRELRVEDAQTLFAMLSTQETARFISPPPATIDGFQRFVEWAIRERERGAYVCFAIVPEGMTTAVGLFQVRALEPSFATAEWGFAVGSPYWGTGLFSRGAPLVLQFVFDVIGVHRLEARASAANGRGNGALRKIGAVQEGVLRRAFLRNGTYHDQVLWSLLRDEWQARRADWRPSVH
jgi:RimJ/RimL family protein N-acetyltransferase